MKDSLRRQPHYASSQPCAGDGKPRAGRCVRHGRCGHAAGAAGFTDGYAQWWVLFLNVFKSARVAGALASAFGDRNCWLLRDRLLPLLLNQTLTSSRYPCRHAPAAAGGQADRGQPAVLLIACLSLLHRTPWLIPAGVPQKRRAVKLTEDSQLFEAGQLGAAPGGGSLTTYKVWRLGFEDRWS